ncbi:MAG: hypothetical protein Q9227_001073 [Pyrenula ochraceoflavens]
MTSVPARQSTSRSHSHSVSLGALNPNHRVNRRKSAASSTANNAAAALVAALGERPDTLGPSTAAHRRSLGSKKGPESTSMGDASTYGTYFLGPLDSDRKGSPGADEDGAIVDGVVPEKAAGSKPRNRRASEGAHLVRGEGKRVSEELRWEHDPAWAITSKLLISKHQQVQLLEAASVLLNIQADGSDTDLPQQQESEGSSASPGLSGISDLHDDDVSSAETTPPPTSDGAFSIPSSKRYSTSSTAYSRSYHSIPSNSYVGSVPSTSPGLAPHRFSGADYRPKTAGTDDSGLAAAAELLNFGTPRTRPAQMSPDIPPVPPLPEQYQAANRLSGVDATPTIFSPFGLQPPTMTQQLSDERVVKPHESFERKTSQDRAIGYNRYSTTDDEDEGVFGRMEE